MRNSGHAFLLLAFICLTLLASGCGMGTKATRPSGTPVRGEDLDPFMYGDEFKSAGRTWDTPQQGMTGDGSMATGGSADDVEGEAANAGDARRRVVGGNEPVYGYRVQIGIDKDKARMEQLAERAEKKVDHAVYLEFEAPFYRVRVGDFRLRSEAEHCVKILKDSGFKDSLWVMSEIIVP